MNPFDFSELFAPVELERISGGRDYAPTQLGHAIRKHDDKGFPSLDGVRLALIGVKDDRRAVGNEGCAHAPDAVREFLYRLYQGNYNLQMADLGNLRGHSVEDTYFAVYSVMSALLKNNILPIIIGGAQDLTWAQYLAYEKLEQTINVASIDPMFDLGDAEQGLHSRSYLSKIILHQPNYLFNFSNVGYQSYFVEQSSIDLMGRLNFDIHRLGQLRADIEQVEPIMRNADMVTFDIGAVRYSDAPGNANATPNGFSGEEACRIARYAGISDKCSSFGIYEINPVYDPAKQTAHLAAQMVWYFIDGVYNRKNDFPFSDKASYTRYRVFIKDHKHEIIFYKSAKSDRWWMEVPYPPNQKLRFERHTLVPCSYNDYEIACREEMPDRWWQTFQKLS